MSQNAGHNNLPENLELNNWLKVALSSANELDRQIALEELLTNGFIPEFENSLKILAEKDPSNNCRMQTQWILRLEHSKGQLKSKIKKLDITPELANQAIDKGDYATLSLLGQMPRKSPPSQSLDLWREALKTATNPRFIETGLNLLTKFGQQSDTNIAVKYLQSPDAQVVCAALSLIAQQDKEIFRKTIRFGLSSKSAVILLHSVHLLRTIDEPETIKYLSNLILNKNPLIRQKALRELTLISFDKVEDLFWQYIAREDHFLLLIKAGFLITFNPALHFPFKLYDILTLSSGVKKYILEMVMNQTIEAAHAAGILNKDINVFISEIKQYIANKRIEQTVRIAASNLKSTDNQMRQSAVETLAAYVNYSQIKTLLERQYKIETDDNIKSYLSSILEDSSDLEPHIEPTKTYAQITAEAQNKAIQVQEQGSIATKEKQPENSQVTHSTDSTKKPKLTIDLSQFPDSDKFARLSPKEQRAYLNSIDCIEKYPFCKNTLLTVLNADIKKNILLEILKKIQNFGNKDDAKQVYELTGSSEPSIAAQAIRTVGIIDLDRILPELNLFLSNDDPRIKSAAFEVYAIADKSAAVQYVGTMLKQTSIPIRQIVLSLLPQLDYPSAEPLLWWLLSHETNVELQDQTGYMIAANPTKEGIDRLYQFTHDKTGEVKPEFTEMWSAALITAENVFGTPANEIEQNCWDKLVSQSETYEEEEKSDYKFRSVVGENEEIQAELESQSSEPERTIFQEILLHLYNYKTQYIFASCILGVIVYFNLGDDQTIHRADKTHVAATTNFVPREGSNRTTQVGSEDWQEGIKSGAGAIIRSPNYANLMRSAADERQSYREEAEQRALEYYAQLAKDPSASQSDRDWAAANTNENYRLGNKAYEKGNFRDAEILLEKAADDNTLNTFGKIDAMQKLLEISQINKNKTNWIKWIDRLLKEAKNVKGFDRVAAFDNMGETFTKLQQLSDSLKANPEAREQLRAGLRQPGVSEEELDKRMDSILNFKLPFED